MKKFAMLTILFLAAIVPQYARSFELPNFNMNGTYVSTTAACNIVHVGKKNGIDVDLDAGYFLAVAAGYRVCDDLRFEAEFGYRNNHLRKIKISGNYASFKFKLSGHVETFSGLANVYYDFPVCFCVRPYVGAGIGYAYTKSKVSFSYISDYVKHHEDGFAWQVIAGVTYPVYNNVDLALEYRFFRCEATKEAQNHDIGLNLRYNF